MRPDLNLDDSSAALTDEGGVEGVARMGQTVHEIILNNQTLYLSPPLEQARVLWISHFQNYVSIISSLPRVSSSRYQVFASSAEGERDYSSIVERVQWEVLKLPYTAIEDCFENAKVFVQKWLQYQALWDVSVSAVSEQLGRDISKWQTLLGDIRSSRATIESSEDERSFGPIVINFRQVQSKVNIKYDSWQKDCQLRFGIILKEELKAMHSDLVETCNRLERLRLDGNTSDVIVAVEYILKAKAAIDGKQTVVSNLESSEKLLQRQRYQFPRDWIAASNVTGALSALLQVLRRRVTMMDAELPSLQMKIRDEDKKVSERVEQFLTDWEKSKPIDGHFVPAEALQTLSMFRYCVKVPVVRAREVMV